MMENYFKQIIIKQRISQMRKFNLKVSLNKSKQVHKKII